MYDGEEGSDQGPKGTYEIYRAEGDALYKQGNYNKAIESYTSALEIREGDRACLVARSKCQLQLGDNTKALEDAESSLTDETEYHKGIFAKAEALYCKGEFELALVFYHRGNKLRPELQEFRLGIQKAKEAIDNAVGTPQAVTLTKEGDLSFFAKQDEKKPKKAAAYSYGRAQSKTDSRRRPPPKSGSDKTVKQLLGELYGDKEFLEKLLRETDTSTRNGQQIYDLACDGLHYLDTRTDFWRQQKPMYSRKREKQERMKGKQKSGNHEQYVIMQLQRIDEDLDEGNLDASLKRAQKTLTYTQNLTDKDLTNRREVLATIHSSIGNAYLELGNYKRALENHSKDLDIANDNDISDAKSRAMDNLGRVHARSGDFSKAIEVWEEKEPMCKSALEATWLYHEIGRCYLEMGRLERAHEYGERALEAANEATDDGWRLNATVLIAQSQVKIKDYKGAIDTFEQALDMSRVAGDETAERAIKRSLDEINRRIAEETRGDADETRQPSRESVSRMLVGESSDYVKGFLRPPEKNVATPKPDDDQVPVDDETPDN